MTLPQKIYYIKNLNTATDKNRDGSRVTDQQKDMVVSYLTNPKLFDQMAMKEENSIKLEENKAREQENENKDDCKMKYK